MNEPNIKKGGDGVSNQEFNQVLQLIIELIKKTVTNEDERRELIASIETVLNTKG